MMKLLLLFLVSIMSEHVLSKSEDWEKFNSSLLIEVTRPNGVFTCTGVALASKLIVTAAHCLDGQVNKVRIFTQSNYDPKAPSLEINEFQIHPSYNPKKSAYRNDIAKISLKSDLPAFIRIHPVHKTQQVAGNYFRFGFGMRQKKNIRTVVTPKFRHMNLRDEVLEMDDTFSRSGDSGGPIYLQNGNTISVVAIHSTLSHGPEGRFSYNPLLMSYLPWIFPN